jgi:hypothetical protein
MVSAIIYLCVVWLISVAWLLRVGFAREGVIFDLERRLTIGEQDFFEASDLVARLDHRLFEREERICELIAERDFWRDEWKACRMPAGVVPGDGWWEGCGDHGGVTSAASAGRLIVGCDCDRSPGKADSGVSVLDVAGDSPAANDDVTASAAVGGGVGVPHDPGTFSFEGSDIASGRSWEDYW